MNDPLNLLLKYVSKDILPLIGSYYYPYKRMYDEVVNELNQNNQRLNNYQLAHDKMGEILQSPIYHNEGKLYFLKKTGIEELKRGYILSERTYDELMKIYQNHESRVSDGYDYSYQRTNLKLGLQSFENDIKLLEDALQREALGETVLTSEFWNEYELYGKMRRDNDDGYDNVYHYSDNDKDDDGDWYDNIYHYSDNDEDNPDD